MKNIMLVFLVACPAAWGATYYIAANGSDSHTAAQARTKSLAWAHLPGMADCGAACASFAPAAGDSFILRGGDTWGASSQVVDWHWPGTAASWIYIGVDKTWYAGGSWKRPVFDCRGTACASGGNQLQVSGSYVIIDNMEFTGLYKDTGGGGANSVLTLNSFIEVRNCYVHGWTHAAGSTDNGQSYSIEAHGGYPHDETSFHDNVIDGAGGAQNDGNGILNGTYVYNNVIRYVVSGLLGDFNVVHDNLVEHNVLSYAGDHCNLIFVFHPESGSRLLAYNNVVRHSGCAGGMAFWLNGNAGCASCTTYAFNNVLYDVDNGIMAIGAHPSSGNTGTYYVYNNTVMSNGGACMGNGEASPRSVTHYANNHCVNANSYCDVTGTTGVNDGGNVLQTTAQAAAQGYNAGQLYALSPAAANNATVGAGVNFSNLCATMPDLCRDATYAVEYDSVNHAVVAPARAPKPRPSTGNWDAGAYEYGAAGIIRADAGPRALSLRHANPMSVGMFRRYVQSNRGLMVYDLAGKRVDNRSIPNNGFFFISQNENSPLEKVLVLP
ncbi:MAG TPA: hypothetical protein VLX68_10620 [Chitinivibrionales bacterium]|nr:hypothetical protein [Chitinivibrionales bacterium]